MVKISTEVERTEMVRTRMVRTEMARTRMVRSTTDVVRVLDPVAIMNVVANGAGVVPLINTARLKKVVNLNLVDVKVNHLFLVRMMMN